MPAASDATVPTGPAGTAAPAGPATPRAAGSGTATPPSRQLVRAIAPGAVTVAMSSAGTPAPGYRIEVRNASGTPVPATVRQELPDGTRATTVTAGGTTTRAAGRAAPGEITWQLTLPARSTTTLHTALSAPPRGRAVTAPACALSEDGSQPYDCATATWSGGTVAAAEVTPAPVWRRTPVLLAALTAALVITIGALWWWQRGRRGRATAAGPGRPPASAGGPGTPLYSGVPVRGSVYPQPAAPGPARRRRTPPVWLAVGVAAAVLAGVVGAAAWTATQRVAAIDTQKQPTSGAWVGRTVSGPVGAPLRETAFEFTVYRVACAAAATAVSDRECQATVGVRNLTPEQQTWHGQLQRAYLPGGTWVSADEAATRAANQGRDVFAEPVSAGSRKVLPLVFTVNGTDAPKQLELRSGVFSAGVRVDVP
ncbi:hypothetical protein GA0070564_101186 [Micromonospora mirobrigensis]|uniref:DUF4352 domain-containing protein n=2 Tax=Micromonospora mirobrigensis TaxID=262898 RepID=A0A1C4U2U2_9ACTN|nr:hypothetical protein [Micromonospora mirobrigensis]SCE66001.1 hypothetical protein GA0070564_101186 [Micromonospora mirobrigensis]